MANIVIVSSGNFIDVSFNDLTDIAQVKVARYKKSSIISVAESSLGHVLVRMDGIVNEWQVSVTGMNQTMPIESIDGVVPVDLDDLYSKLKSLMI